MPAKKPPPKDEKPQKDRFIDAAKDAEADVSGAAFDRAFKRIVPPKKRPS